jgi:hypothetical protein
MNFGFEPLQKDTAKSTSSTNSKQTVPSTTSTLPSINNKSEALVNIEIEMMITCTRYHVHDTRVVHKQNKSNFS